MTNTKRLEEPLPDFVIDLDRIESNVRTLSGMCRARGISLTSVVKGVNGLVPVARAMLRGGCDHLASSRVGHLRHLRQEGVESPLALIRVPAPSEAAEVVQWADWSLQSDVSVLETLDREADRVGRRHGVVLMIDLGDLREGWFDEGELRAAAVRVERDLPALELLGVGTNLGCYGSIKPTIVNLSRLVEISRGVESAIGRSLPIVSGGATSSIPLLADGSMPVGVTNLRVGEGVLTARDLPCFHGVEVPGIRSDALTFRAEVIEVRNKPSYPVGEICVNAFGETPSYTDRGVRRRALLAAGSLDFGKPEALIPLEPGVEILGSSSDHLICDVEDCPRALSPGDVLEFGVFYAAMMFLTEGRSVRISYRGGKGA